MKLHLFEIAPQHKSSMGILKENVLAGAHKQFEYRQYPEMHLIGRYTEKPN